MWPLRALTVCTLLTHASFIITHEATPTLESTPDLTILIQNFTQSVSRHGFHSEVHTVVTDDGYLLTLFRLTRRGEQARRLPVLIMHGLLQSSDSWVDAGPDAGLAYLLAAAGHDIWIGNVRGNYYSRAHKYLHPRDVAFWDFCTDEIGRYDIPALVDYVLWSTGASQLNYIGFSQGAGAYFIMCAEMPQYCNKARMVIALAPSTRHLLTKSPIFRGVTEGCQQFEEVLRSNGFNEVFTKGTLTQNTLGYICRLPELFTFCNTLVESLDSVYSTGKLSLTNETVRNVAQHFPAGTSLKNMVRFGQAMNSKTFVKFDYGNTQNALVYGTPRPPEYNLSSVSVPVFVIYGENDGIVDKGDVEWCMKKLPFVVERYLVKDPLWGHLDMVYSRHTKRLVFPKINEYLLKFNK